MWAFPITYFFLFLIIVHINVQASGLKHCYITTVTQLGRCTSFSPDHEQNSLIFQVSGNPEIVITVSIIRAGTNWRHSRKRHSGLCRKSTSRLCCFGPVHTHSRQSRKNVWNSGNNNHPLSTKLTELNTFDFADNVDGAKLAIKGRYMLAIKSKVNNFVDSVHFWLCHQRVPGLLLFLVCVSETIIGQPRNSVFIRRV